MTLLFKLPDYETMALNPRAVCVHSGGGTSTPARLEGKIGRGWITTQAKQRREKQMGREQAEKEQEQNTGLCISHPMQGCTVLIQHWGHGSAHAVHPKRRWPRASHDQGLNWEPWKTLPSTLPLPEVSAALNLLNRAPTCSPSPCP